jgi:hypothetical protein
MAQRKGYVDNTWKSHAAWVSALKSSVLMDAVVLRVVLYR